MFDSFVSIFKKKSKENLENYSILFIDDSEMDRRFIERIFTKRNFRVFLSADGEAGLEAAAKEKPDLILLDIVLPGISGIEVCKKLKKDEKTKDIPVVFLTGMDTPKNLIDCYEYGAEDFLNKSIHPKALISQVEQVIKDCSSGQNS